MSQFLLLGQVLLNLTTSVNLYNYQIYNDSSDGEWEVGEDEKQDYLTLEFLVELIACQKKITKKFGKSYADQCLIVMDDSVRNKILKIILLLTG
jgi:hypothetical protein